MCSAPTNRVSAREMSKITDWAETAGSIVIHAFRVLAATACALPYKTWNL